MITEAELSPLERLRREAMRKKSWSEVWQSYVQDQIDAGIEPDENAELFNLSNTIEME